MKHLEESRCTVNCNRSIFVIGILLLAFAGEPSYAIPAFPGAEGYGANAVGGRGGRVIKVTNLNNSGSGSFRDAVTASGPRIVVFEVSGIIELTSEVRITRPFLTIAGQTSPGGILITGERTVLQAGNIIVQHMRFRAGPARNGTDASTLDSLNLYGPGSNHPPGVKDVIIDHCSMSWGIDEVLAMSYGPTDFTVQWSIVSEGLDNAGHSESDHSKGAFFSGANMIQDVNATFHHNYIAHNRARNPEIDGGSNGYDVFVDYRNNVMYNFYSKSVGKLEARAHVNLVHNYIKAGPDSDGNMFEWRHSPSGTPAPGIYTYNNMGTKQDGSNPDAWNVASGFSTSTTTSEDWRRMSPWPAPAVTTAQMSNSYALEMLESVGATKPFRDSVDTRVVSDFANRTGRIRNSVSFPGDFPSFSSPTPPADNDDDGMADSWESDNGLNTSSDDSAADADGDGYTNIEEYLHYLADAIQTDGGGSKSPSPEPPTDLRAE